MMIRSIWSDGPKQLSFFDTPGPVVIAYSGRTAQPFTTPPPSPSELQEKRDAKRRLDIMRYRDIRRAASCARQIWHRKNALHIEIEGHVVVCIDEVRTLLGINPVKNGKENNYLGCTFTARIPRKNKWRKVPGLGMHSSTVRGSHGNSQTLWEMTEEKWPVEK